MRHRLCARKETSEEEVIMAEDLIRSAIEYIEDHCGYPRSNPPKVTAPQWLIDQMERLKKLPPPSVEKVREQWAASAKFRRENAHCPKHKEYFGDTVPGTDNDCDGCWNAYVDKQQTPDSVRLLYEAMDRHDGLKIV